MWFYQGSYAESTAASIYDAGNMVIWWLGIPAMAFVAWQSYRRRSLALALILVAFLAQWVSWARIDRAAFQYHYYTSLPFVILALGYFVAEIWHGPSRRTWLLARASAAVALMGPVILWLLRYPLCAVAGVESVSPGSQACNGNPGNLVVTPAMAAMVVVALVTVLVLRVAAARASTGHARTGGRWAIRDLLPIVATAAVGGVALAIARLLPDGEPLFTVNGVVPEIIALIAAVPLGLIAIQVLTARDAQRFVAGLVTAAGGVVRDPVPQHRGAPDAVGDRQRVPGPAADLPVRLPVQRQHHGAARDVVRRPGVPGPCRLAGRRVRRDRATSRGRGARRWGSRPRSAASSRGRPASPVRPSPGRA